MITPSTPDQIYDSLFTDKNDFTTTFFVDQNESKLIGEFFYLNEFHSGWNQISVSKAEEYIPRMRSALLSIKRKTQQKKLLSFIDRFVWSFGPEFGAKWGI